MATYNIDLEVNKALAYEDVLVVHRFGDKTRLIVSIYDKGVRNVVADSTAVIFKCRLPNNKKIIETATIQDGNALYTFDKRFEHKAGLINDAHFVFGNYSTQNFQIKVLEN